MSRAGVIRRQLYGALVTGRSEEEGDAIVKAVRNCEIVRAAVEDAITMYSTSELCGFQLAGTLAMRLAEAVQQLQVAQLRRQQCATVVIGGHDAVETCERLNAHDRDGRGFRFLPDSKG